MRSNDLHDGTDLSWFNGSRPPCNSWLPHSSLKGGLLSTQEWTVISTWKFIADHKVTS